MKKQFIIESVSLSDLYKIEVLLNKYVNKERYSLDKEKGILQIEDDGIDLKVILDEIEKINEDIIVSEKEYKQVKRKVLYLKNLDCVNCANIIERRARREMDAERIVVDFNTRKFTIETSNDEVLNNLKERVERIAIDVDSNIKVLDTLDENTEDEEKGLTKSRKIELIIGGIIFLLGFITKTIFNLLNFDIGFGDSIFSLKIVIIYVTYVPAYILLSMDVLIDAFRNAIHGHVFDEKFLMSLATVVALIINYYDEGVFVMLFYQLGELLQDYAVDRSRNSIKELINIKPDVANVLINDDVISLEPKEVLVGDKIVVKTGEKVPLDGVVISGNADIDESALTGESLEKYVTVDSYVLSGSFVKSGSIIIHVEKAYEDSMVAKILDLVENASANKSKSENFISKFARYYTPVIVGLALLLGSLLPLISKKYPLNFEGYKESIRVALIFLVASCPCALVISVPLGFFGGIGGASKEGILVKGSNYLEALTNLKAVALDKTGTITEGKFVLKKVISCSNYKKDEILYYAAHAEYMSNHPIARSIVDAYENNINPEIVKQISTSDERGIGAIVDGKEVWIGRKEYLKSKNIEINKEVKALSNFTISIDGVNAGYFIFRDRIKSNAKSTIKELRLLGVENVVMLTGDNDEIAKEVAFKTGVDSYFSEMTPIEKVEKTIEIKSKLGEKDKIAFVGDGVNDTPVLSAADVGIAMGAIGSAAAIEVADVVLMTDDLNNIPKIIKIAKKTKKIVIENIVFALFVKAIVLVLSLVGVDWISDFLIYGAIFADVGVSILAVLNSLRAMKVEK